MEMEYPVRKHLRLENWNYSSEGIYFITICTKEKRCILSDVVMTPDGPRISLTSIGKIVEKYILSTKNIPGIYVDRYVIMPNHIHMLLIVDLKYGPPRASVVGPPRASVVGPPRASAPTMSAIPNAVSSLKRLVDREVGANIWQRSYHDHVVRNESEYLKIAEYIEYNPAKWGDDCYAMP